MLGEIMVEETQKPLCGLKQKERHKKWNIYSIGHQ